MPGTGTTAQARTVLRTGTASQAAASGKSQFHVQNRTCMQTGESRRAGYASRPGTLSAGPRRKAAARRNDDLSVTVNYHR